MSFAFTKKIFTGKNIFVEKMYISGFNIFPLIFVSA